MSIKPISDIVLEVAKAADPVSYKSAAERLGNIAGAASSVPEKFAGTFPGTFVETLGGMQPRKPAAPHLPFDPALALVHMQNRDALAAAPASAYEKFEGFVLQTFIESMLPKGEALFGGGTAGEIWRSMLAEGLGAQLSRVGGIGIAEMLSHAGTEKDGTTDTADGSAGSVSSS